MIDLVKLQKVIWVLALLMSIIILLMFLGLNSKRNRKIVKVGNYLFNSFSKISLFRRGLFSLRKRIYNNTLDEDWFIRYKVILYIIFSWIGGLMAATIVISFFSNNLYVTFTLLFLCYQVKEMIKTKHALFWILYLSIFIIFNILQIFMLVF